MKRGQAEGRFDLTKALNRGFNVTQVFSEDSQEKKNLGYYLPMDVLGKDTNPLLNDICAITWEACQLDVY